MYRKTWLALLQFSAVAVPAVMSLGSAQAVTASASIAVSATVLSFCSISATTLPFGTYSSLVNNGTATVTVSCTSGTPYNVGLDLGVGSGATIALRKMTLGATANTLGYQLYSDAGRSTVWGPTIGTNTVIGAGTGVAQPLTVYGQIPAGELSAPGAYTDTISATITY